MQVASQVKIIPAASLAAFCCCNLDSSMLKSDRTTCLSHSLYAAAAADGVWHLLPRALAPGDYPECALMV
jgi:hypothetical protein